MSNLRVVPIVMDVDLPAGVLGPDPVSYDVRCFLVSHDDGVVLIDTGIRADVDLIEEALLGLGADWGDVTDVILTHGHQDHISALPTVTAKAPSATVWAGHGEVLTTPVRRVGDGDVIRGLRVLATPGHTPGHLSLWDEAHRILFAGDVVGNMHGHLVMAPEQFTADQQQAMLSLRKLAAMDFDRLIFSHGEELPAPAAALAEILKLSANAY